MNEVAPATTNGLQYEFWIIALYFCFCLILIHELTRDNAQMYQDYLVKFRID